MPPRSLGIVVVVLSLLAAVQSPSVPEPGSYRGCPAEGSGGDAVLNALCNRVDTAATVESTTVTEIANLPSPGVLTGLARAKWTPEELQLAKAQEARTVQVEGFIVREEPAMLLPWNCNQHYAPYFADVRVWVAPSPAAVPAPAPGATSVMIANEERMAAYKASESAILCVLSPRWRAANPAWSEAAIKALVDSGARVRVAGDLLYAEDLAPELVGNPALLTLWTIHPVTDIETMQNGVWVELGSGPAAAR